jgi:hypothetical protein
VNDRRLAQIHARRERLVAKAAVQRDDVAQLLAPWRGPLHFADRGLAAAEYLRAHPALVALAAAVLVILSPKRALRWTQRAFVLWRGYRWAIRTLSAIAR